MMKGNRERQKQRALEPQKWLYLEPESNSNGENSLGWGLGSVTQVPGTEFVQVKGVTWREVVFHFWTNQITTGSHDTYQWIHIYTGLACFSDFCNDFVNSL